MDIADFNQIAIHYSRQRNAAADLAASAPVVVISERLGSGESNLAAYQFVELSDHGSNLAQGKPTVNGIDVFGDAPESRDHVLVQRK